VVLPLLSIRVKLVLLRPPEGILLSRWCTDLADYYSNEFHEDFSFQLVFDYLGLLIDESEDVGGEHRDQIGSIANGLWVKFAVKFLFVLLHCPWDVILDDFAVVIQEIGHQYFYFRFQIY
jgi:hypothetical protein